MQYISTRGLAPTVSGAQALLNGIAPDGGLYIPAEPLAPLPAGADFKTPMDAVLECFFDDIPPELRTDVMEMEDLKPDMILKGTVRNVIDFGAFVDIGVHQDGLVHISELSNRFVKHPSEVVSVGDVVQVRVLSVDLKKKRIALSMKMAKKEK
jgi:polyribonucleotide nucleotidyltransferase